MQSHIFSEVEHEKKKKFLLYKASTRPHELAQEEIFFLCSDLFSFYRFCHKNRHKRLQTGTEESLDFAQSEQTGQTQKIIQKLEEIQKESKKSALFLKSCMEKKRLLWMRSAPLKEQHNPLKEQSDPLEEWSDIRLRREWNEHLSNFCTKSEGVECSKDFSSISIYYNELWENFIRGIELKIKQQIFEQHSSEEALMPHGGFGLDEDETTSLTNSSSRQSIHKEENHEPSQVIEYHQENIQYLYDFVDTVDRWLRDNPEEKKVVEPFLESYIQEDWGVEEEEITEETSFDARYHDAGGYEEAAPNETFQLRLIRRGFRDQQGKILRRPIVVILSHE